MADSDKSTSPPPSASPAAAPVAEKSSATQTKLRKKSRHLPPYHVVLLNDDDHTYEYVIEMLRSLFGHNEQRGYVIADEVNSSGRAIVFTTHREYAELKREQIISFGTDERVATCQGSMSALIEPAED